MTIHDYLDFINADWWNIPTYGMKYGLYMD